MKPMAEKIKIGISACLLGERVRYDGGHKLDRIILDTLGQLMEFVPVCPEVECGLSVPREEMQLEGSPDNPLLVTVQTGRDFTARMKKWGEKRLNELQKEDLCGFIFKCKSPSCGMKHIKVYDNDYVSSSSGTGIWAGMFMNRFPELLSEEEICLHDTRKREKFIESVFELKRWREMTE